MPAPLARTSTHAAFLPGVASAVRTVGTRPIAVLIVDEDPRHTEAMRELLTQDLMESGAPRFVVSAVSTLADALLCLGEEDLAKPSLAPAIDTIVLSLSLPEARGIPALAAMRAQAGAIPIVALVGSADEGLAYRAIREGAADHLVRGECHVTALSRSLRYAAERQAGRAALDAGNRALTRLLGNLPGIAYRCGLEERCSLEFVSQGVEQVTGYSSNDFMGLRRRPPRVWFPRLLHPDDRSRVWQSVRDAVEARIPYEIECRFEGLTGERWLWGRGRPVVDEDGQIRSVEGFMADVTERKQAERAAEAAARDLADKEVQLRQSQKLEGIGRLAGGVAHDFNNLLMVILANAEFARESVAGDGAVPGAGIEEIDEIMAAGHRAASLTRQLLLFSRKQLVQPTLVSLNAVLAEAESLLRRVIGADIILVTLADASHDVVLADRGQLEQVIINLAVNARDAMPAGGTLTIETSSSTSTDCDRGNGGLLVGCPLNAGNYLTLTVTDTGIGMDEATQANIFEPFFTTKGPTQGTGLGLATVYGIVTHLGGAIRLRSAPGEGASFTILLPQQTELTMPGTPELRDNGSGRAGRLPRGDERVLVVEDESAVRLAIRRLLERQGYRVLEAQHAKDALDLLARHGEEVALVITDVVMPGMSGDLLVEVLRARSPGIGILVMSGYPGGVAPGLAEGNHDLGTIDAFLQKPIAAEALLTTVRSTIDRRRGRR